MSNIENKIDYTNIDGYKVLQKANQAMREGDYQLASELYRQCYSENKHLEDIVRFNQKVLMQKMNLATASENIQGFYEQKKNLVDISFYRDLYSDLEDLESEQLEAHFRVYGEQEGRHPNIDKFIESMGFDKSKIPSIDIEEAIVLNPLLTGYSKSQLYLIMLQYKKVNLIRFSTDNKKVGEFYSYLGEYYLIKKDIDKAKQILLYANYIYETPRISELLGNIEFDKQYYSGAAHYYANAVQLGGESWWLYVNIISCLHQIGEYEKSIIFCIKGLEIFPHHSKLLKLLDDSITLHWEETKKESESLAFLQKREELIKCVNSTVEFYNSSYQKAFSITNNGEILQSIPTLNDKKILIIGDYHIPQCVRYRIDQKYEQLRYSGYDVSTSDWTNIDFNQLSLADIIIFYRTPALPPIVKAITKAKSLGKIVIFEIDDLIFDQVYPAKYSEYAGAISIGQYFGLTHDMALYHSSVALCDYGIASTEPLKKYIAKLIPEDKVYVHRNGLDHHNKDVLESGYFESNIAVSNNNQSNNITIFYGSGTLAHNSDFIEISLPAIERILNEYPNALFMVVGHLTLPKEFTKRHEGQLIQLSKTKTINDYWNLLANADINLAVLENSVINNCKSELKWFEAACFKTPSIVSATRNYEDVIENNIDGVLATSTEDWYMALKTLITDSQLRRTIGENAYNRAMHEYSVPYLSNNIDCIVKKIAQHHRGRNEK